MFKNICETKSDWDDDLVEPLYSKWKNFVYSLKSLTFSVPKCVFYSEDFVKFIELQRICRQFKSSVCRSYLCPTNNQQGNQIKLLTSKTRVAPAKPLTILRLELLSCLLLSKLIKTI